MYTYFVTFHLLHSVSEPDTNTFSGSVESPLTQLDKPEPVQAPQRWELKHLLDAVGLVSLIFCDAYRDAN